MAQSSEAIRIGQILIEHGVLNEQQVFEILQRQRSESVPFGVLAERMFDVTVDSVEEAWIEQYCRLTGAIDLEQQQIDASALKLINRRQAWQFEILPLHFESSGELLIAASRRRFARAVAFVAHRIEPVVYFRIAESEQLRSFLRENYPMPEVSEEMLRRAKDIMTRPGDAHAA